MRHDIVGDVHGCYEELMDLMALLGYELSTASGALPGLLSVQPPEGRRIGFVGDLVDRGPASDLVLNLVIQLHERGVADCVSGNHDNKFMRYLKGNPVRVGKALQQTIEQVAQHGEQFVERVRAFLTALPLVHTTDSLVLVHAAYRENVTRKFEANLALYGEVDGTKDANGFPSRKDTWEKEYSGTRTVVHGHIVVPEPDIQVVSDGIAIANVDTGCVFGGRLTALRLPEMETVSVPARRVYCDRSSNEPV